MLVPDVERTGLPLTELLPYTKIETKEIKKKNRHANSTKKKRRRKRKRAGGGATHKRGREGWRQAKESKGLVKCWEKVKATARQVEGKGKSRETTKKGKHRKEKNKRKQKKK